MDDLQHIRAVMQRHEQELLAKRNVVGVGIGFKETAGRKTDRMSIVVMVEEKQPVTSLDAADAIPPEIEGIPTDVKAVGRIEVQSR